MSSAPSLDELMHDYLDALKSGASQRWPAGRWWRDRRCPGWGSFRHRAVSLAEIAVQCTRRAPGAGHRKLGEALMSEPVLEQCEACGRRVPGYDTVVLSSETKSRSLCSNCFNDTMAAWHGIDFQHPTFEPLTLHDVDGVSHLFHFCSRLGGPGLAVEALEIKGGQPQGYEFQVLGKLDQDPLELFRRLYERIRRTLARKHIVDGELGPRIGDENVVRGRITWDDESHGEVPRLVIDGKELSWEEFGRMLMTYEGFQFKLAILDRSDEP